MAGLRPGHPRLEASEDVDARGKAGHDEFSRNAVSLLDANGAEGVFQCGRFVILPSLKHINISHPDTVLPAFSFLTLRPVSATS
jgi:hypothetical protein